MTGNESYARPVLAATAVILAKVSERPRIRPVAHADKQRYAYSARTAGTRKQRSAHASLELDRSSGWHRDGYAVKTLDGDLREFIHKLTLGG